TLYPLYSLTIRRPRRPPLFPYTPLFRSRAGTAVRNIPIISATTARSRQRPARRTTVWTASTPPPLSQPATRIFICRPRRWCGGRSEEHTSELQSRENLVCRLLLEKKKKN